MQEYYEKGASTHSALSFALGAVRHLAKRRTGLEDQLIDLYNWVHRAERGVTT